MKEGEKKMVKHMWSVVLNLILALVCFEVLFVC